MKKSILFAIAALLAFTNIISAQLVFVGGSSGTGTDFFEEANWVDTATGMAPVADTLNPLEFTNGQLLGTITSDLSISGDFAVEAVGVGENVLNIRMDNGRTLTLEDNATLSCQLLTGPAGEEINVVLSDNAELTTERISRTAFDLSGNATLNFTGTMPELDTDRVNLASDWTGSITTQLPNGNRMNLIGDDGTALFNVVTIDGEVATNDDIDTIQFGASIIHTLAAPLLLGDVNRDGAVNFFDISLFILILANPLVEREEADVNLDGVVDFFDISPFIEILATFEN